MIFLKKKIYANTKALRIILILFVFFSNTMICSEITTFQIKKKENPEYFLKKADSCKIVYDYPNSLKYISKAKTYYKKTNNIDGEILCKIKEVELYRHATLLENAANSLKEIKTKINQNKEKISNYTLMYYYNRKAAILSEYYKNYDSTFYYSKKALTLAQNTNHFDISLTSLMEIGLVVELQEKYDQAIDYFTQCKLLAKQLNNNQIELDALANLARVYEKNGEYLKSIEACDEGLSIQEETISDLQKVLFYQTKQKAYNLLGDKTKAYENLLLRLKYTDLYYKKSEKEKLLEIYNRHKLKEKNEQILKDQETIKTAKKKQLFLMYFFIISFTIIIVLAYYNKKINMANQKLNLYAKENAFLLEEANHRINNNLQIVIFLISNELEKVSNKENYTINKILYKIKSIAILHRYLYKSKDKQKVDITNYLTDIIKNFEDLFRENDIKIETYFNTSIVANDDAMYYGLLLTELFINSIKYAFDNQEEKLITLRMYDKGNKIYFNYTDNGKNTIGKEIIPELVINLCKQIKGNFTITTKNGFEIQISTEINTSQN